MSSLGNNGLFVFLLFVLVTHDLCGLDLGYPLCSNFRFKSSNVFSTLSSKIKDRGSAFVSVSSLFKHEPTSN